MDDHLDEYIETRHKKKIFAILSEVWEELQKPSSMYIVLNKNASWRIKIHAIYRNGVAVYHEEIDGKQIGKGKK